MASRSEFDLIDSLRISYKKAEKIFNEQNKEINVFLTCTLRDKEEQAKLYAQGRTASGKIVTNAKPGQSPHNFNKSFAFDIAFIGLDKKLKWTPSLFKQFADLIKSIDNTIVWGGDFKTLSDAPHFELKNWKTLAK